MATSGLPAATVEVGAAERKPQPRHVAAVVSGNALEFYDFLTFAFFAVYIGHTFFPSDNPVTSLLASLATFGAGFLARPVGAFFLGRLADRIGRKPVLLLTFGLMGFSVIGLALTPTYATIGIAAPILAVGFRLLQGFAVGGELGASVCYLFESAPVGQRGFYVSLQNASQSAAALLAGLVGTVLAALLGPADLAAWGWRLAFLLGALILPIGLWLRTTLEETLHAEERAAPAAMASTAPATARVVILGGLLLGASTIAFYVLSYLTTYAITTLGMDARFAFGATVMVGLFAMIAEPPSGWLTDRVGRRPVMIGGFLLIVLLAFPAFRLLSLYSSPAILYAVTAVLAVPMGMVAPPIVTALAELLPKQKRSGVVAVTYAVAIALFGGSAQFIVAWLIAVTGDAMAPAWYMAAAALFGLAAAILIPESSPLARPPWRRREGDPAAV